MTLPGFENRLRLLRKWSGPGLPEKIVDHTILADPRQPSFLHLSLLQDSAVRDLFFTDLPGEWTTDLIKRADVADRFRFLKRADALIITLQASLFLGKETRNSQTQSARILLQRLRDNVRIETNIPIILAITRCDITGATVPPAIYSVIDFASELGFGNVSHIPVASFSNRPDVPSGMGVASLVDAVLSPTIQSPSPFVSSFHESRMFARFQSNPEANT
jgi:hypothetical protein